MGVTLVCDFCGLFGFCAVQSESDLCSQVPACVSGSTLMMAEEKQVGMPTLFKGDYKSG